MSRMLKKALYLTIALCLVLSSTVFSASAAPATYSAESNSGKRNELCTTLDGTSASSYYTGQYTYEKLSNLSENQLLSSLRSLMTDTHTKITSYDECRDYAPITDCENGGNGSSFVTLYSSYVADYSSDLKGGNGTRCNKEHVWPQSLGGFGTSGGGSDLHHIRPVESKINSTRGNNKYGETSGKNVTGNLSGTSGGTYGNDIYEPLDNVKGDVARICLYVYVRWGATSGYTCNDLEIVFTDIETLLAWCELDPVDTWEMGRNEVVQKIQGNRNVFIDYPELAWIMLGEEVPENMSTPSNSSDSDNTGSGSGDTAECNHSSTTLEGKLDATCTENGYTGDLKCNNCKEIVTKGEAITSKGHSYGEAVITKEPTETENGTGVKTCGKCGDKITVILSAIGKELPVEIVSNNVYYKDTLRLMYAVRSKDGYDVKLKIYDSQDNLVEIITTYNVESVKSATLKTFTSSVGVPAQDIDTEFFAVAELYEGESLVACSPKERYSVLEYLYERLTVSQNVTLAQKTMYKRLLAFANSSDIVVNGDTAENSIANYAYVRVDGGTVDGTYSTAIVKSGAVINSLTANGFVSGVFPKWKLVSYDLENTPISSDLTDATLTVSAGMAYVLTPTVPKEEQKTYSYTFSAKQYSANGTKDLGGVSWTLAGDGKYWGYDSTKGQQLGSAGDPYKSMTLTSDAFSNVTEIVINTSGAKDVAVTLNVYVGKTLVGTVTLTSSAEDYTIEVDGLSGEIKLEYVQTSSRALYVKSIEVDYAE